MEYNLFLDTNALLNLGNNAFNEYFIIAQKTLQEIESIKSSAVKDGEVKYKARNISRLLNENENSYEVVKFSGEIQDIINEYYLENTPDNIILASAKHYQNQGNNIIICTDDLNCKFIANKIFGFKTKGVNDINLVKNLEEYKGFKDITLSDEEMSYFYLHLSENKFNNLINEYLIIRKSDGTIVDYRKWNGVQYAPISYKTINDYFMGKIKPINPEQTIAFDLLQNKDIFIKIISGKFGSGKDFIMLSNALKLIQDGKYDKLVYLRNTVGVKDVDEIGFIPGTSLEKILPFAMPLADHLGGVQGLEMKISSGVIEVEYLGYIRGRDFKHSIIYVSEAENLTKEHVQLLIGRIGEGSTLWMNGDFKQTDSPLFRMNNGFTTAIQRLSGDNRFGYVQLQKTERSEAASMADLLD